MAASLSLTDEPASLLAFTDTGWNITADDLVSATITVTNSGTALTIGDLP
jgi:hypothetical protein